MYIEQLLPCVPAFFSVEYLDQTWEQFPDVLRFSGFNCVAPKCKYVGDRSERFDENCYFRNVIKRVAYLLGNSTAILHVYTIGGRRESVKRDLHWAVSIVYTAFVNSPIASAVTVMSVKPRFSALTLLDFLTAVLLNKNY